METPEIQITQQETPILQPTETLPVRIGDIEITETAVVQNPIIEDESENSENSEELVLEEVPQGETHEDVISEDDTEKSLQEHEEKVTPEDKLIETISEFGEKIEGLKDAIQEFSHTLEAAPKNFEGFNEIFNVLLIRLQALRQEYEYKKAEKGEDHPETQALKQKIDTLQYMIGMIIGFIMGQALSY